MSAFLRIAMEYKMYAVLSDKYCDIIMIHIHIVFNVPDALLHEYSPDFTINCILPIGPLNIQL